MIYLTSNTLHPVEERYSSLEEEVYEYDVDHQKFNTHMGKQQVFYDHEERNDEQCPPSAPYLSRKCNIRRPTEEEIMKLTIATVEKAKSKYWLRNITMNKNEGVPRGIFMKEKTQGAPKKTQNKQRDKNVQKHVQKEEDKELHKNKQKIDDTNKREKEVSKRRSNHNVPPLTLHKLYPR